MLDIGDKGIVLRSSQSINFKDTKNEFNAMLTDVLIL